MFEGCYLGREDIAAAIPQTSEQRPTSPRRPQAQDQLEAYAQRIRETFPDLSIGKYGGRMIPPGQNNDVITADDFAIPHSKRTIIFRFPRYAQAMEEMTQEIAILRALQGRLPLPIPNPTYSSQDTRGVGQAFMGYEKLPGKPLYREMLESVDGEEAVQQLATQLAEFLRALHSVLADVFAIPLPVANDRASWVAMYGRIREMLFAHMRTDVRERVTAHFERFLDDLRNFEWTPALIHGDFGPGNILYDAKRRTISGIIDFSSAGLGDPATDLAALITPHSYGADFLPRLEGGYPGITGLRDRARFYMGTFALQEALFGVEHNDREAFESGMAGYT
jgi:aminoglycoside 2''-phosphotransferase